MTDNANSDLERVASAVVGRAQRGEDVEVYVARGHDTEVRAFEGEVESLSSAASAGIGVRGSGKGKAGAQVYG